MPRPPASVAAPRRDSAAILETLRRRITHHELPPGTKLLEVELSEEFGVSRARIRDVLAALEQRRLVRRIPHRGARVERLDLHEAVHLYQVRESLEGLSARLAALRAPRGEWDDLVRTFGAVMEQHAQRGEFDAYLEKVELLRARILAAAGNPVLAEILQNIQDRTRMVMRRIILLPGRIETGLREHRAVLDALVRGDAAGAEAAMRANIRSSIEALQRYESFVL